MKIALCLSGQMRSFRECYENLKKNVIDILHPDIFVYTSKNVGFCRIFSSSFRPRTELKIFDKDIYELCDIPIPGFEGCTVEATEDAPRYNPSDLLSLVDTGQTVEVTMGPKAKAGNGAWKTVEGSLAAFINQLLLHKEGNSHLLMI